MNEWDAVAAGWDEDPTVQAYAAAVHASLIEVLATRGRELVGTRVLDFGAGTGLLTERLVSAGARVDAVDSSPAMLDVLRTKGDRLGWTEVSIGASVPRDGRTYDLVVCSSVCAFLDDYPATARELVSSLEPGGLFVQWDWERSTHNDHGLTRAEIATTLAESGLMEVTVETAFVIDMGADQMQPLIGIGARP